MFVLFGRLIYRSLIDNFESIWSRLEKSVCHVRINQIKIIDFQKKNEVITYSNSTKFVHQIQSKELFTMLRIRKFQKWLTCFQSHESYINFCIATTEKYVIRMKRMIKGTLKYEDGEEATCTICSSRLTSPDSFFPFSSSLKENFCRSRAYQDQF